MIRFRKEESGVGEQRAVDRPDAPIVGVMDASRRVPAAAEAPTDTRHGWPTPHTK